MTKLLLVPLVVGTMCAQPPAPSNAVAVVSVTFAPAMVQMVTVKVHNKGALDITHLSGMLSYTPYGLAAVQARCSTSTLERYLFNTNPYLRKFTQLDSQKQPVPNKGTLMAGEDLEFQCGIQPTKIQQASFAPDTVIYADRTWSGDQSTAEAVFRERTQIATDYAILGKAVLDAEASADPPAKYAEILAEWLPRTGITQTATTMTIKSVPNSMYMPYMRLQGYAALYTNAVSDLAYWEKTGAKGVTVKGLVQAYLPDMLHRDAQIGAGYHIHAEAK